VELVAKRRSRPRLRLALLAAADLEAVAIWPLLSALMQEPKGLWGLEWKAELQRLLRMRARSLGPSELQSLCGRMLDGPPRSMYRPDTDVLFRYKGLFRAELARTFVRRSAGGAWTVPAVMRLLSATPG
jgi:hypothetical protein